VREQPNIKELASAASAGLLAEEMVFALGTLLRGGGLEDDDARDAVEAGKAVLTALVSPNLTVPAAAGVSQLAADEEALDALQAALVQAPDEDVQEYLKRLIEVLEAALNNEDVQARQSELDSLQKLFATLGHITLARANSLSRAPQERLSWPTSPATSAFSCGDPSRR
jgi:thioredoxin-like negative regulator of GroEL